MTHLAARGGAGGPEDNAVQAATPHHRARRAAAAVAPKSGNRSPVLEWAPVGTGWDPTLARSGSEPVDVMHHSKRIVEMAERSARKGATEDCLRQLRGLCLDEFALVIAWNPGRAATPACPPYCRRWRRSTCNATGPVPAGVPLLNAARGLHREDSGVISCRSRADRSRVPAILDFGCGCGHHASSDVLPHRPRRNCGLRSLGSCRPSLRGRRHRLPAGRYGLPAGIVALR